MPNSICFGDQINVGQLLEQLNQISKKLKTSKAPPDILFDFGYICPAGFGSYRGYYEDLAIHYEEERWCKHAHFENELKEMLGNTITGHKGGDYRVHADTPVWVANPGNTGSTTVWLCRDRG